MWPVLGDTLSLDLEAAGKDPDNVSEQDLIDLGYKPIKAWVKDSLVVFVYNDGLYDVGL